jgi:hypothetical protein
LLLAAMLVAAMVAAGCGGDDTPDEETGELVRYEVNGGRLVFDLDSPDDRSVVPIPDAVLVVERNARATFRVADRPAKRFTVAPAEFQDLAAAVDEVDFASAEAEFGGGAAQGRPTFSVSHDGTTLHLGDDFAAITYGEGPELADQVADLLGILGQIAGRGSHAPRRAD